MNTPKITKKRRRDRKFIEIIQIQRLCKPAAKKDGVPGANNLQVLAEVPHRTFSTTSFEKAHRKLSCFTRCYSGATVEEDGNVAYEIKRMVNPQKGGALLQKRWKECCERLLIW